MDINIKLLHPSAKVPLKATSAAAGLDIYSFGGSTLLKSGETKLISTGIAVEIPEGYEGQIRSRSGLASQGVFVLNSPGTIDSDYRGEVKVLLHNVGDDTIIFPDMRIAQLVISKIEQVNINIKSKLSKTTRGKGGFGSTGR